MRKNQINVFIITWLGYAALYLTRKNFGVVKVDLHQELGLTLSDLGLIETCFLVVYAAGQFTSGFVGDLMGAKRLIALGLIGSAACSFGFVYGQEPLFFALFFAMNGLFQSTGWANNVKALEPWFLEEQRGKVLSWWGTNQQVGGLFGTVFAVYLAARLGWQSAFVVPSAIVLVIGLIVASFLAEPKVSSQQEIIKIASVKARTNYKIMLGNPVLWSLSMAYFGLKLIRYSLLFWLPFYLHETLKIPKEDAGYLSVAFEIGGILGSLMLGWLSDRYFLHSRERLMLPIFLLLALSLYIYRDYSSASMTVNFLLLALIGFFVFGPDTFISGVCAQDIGGKHLTGSAAGFINGVGSVGAIFQGLITAYVSTHWGWPSLFTFFVALALFSSVMLVPLWRNTATATEKPLC